MAFHRSGKGKPGKRGHQSHSWQRKMFTKLVMNEDASFERRDIESFIHGMDSFDSKPELLTLLTDERNHGEKRLNDCLSFLSGPACVDNVLAPIIANIITKETARPLHKARRSMVINMIFNAPGLLEFLATTWVGDINNSGNETAQLVCEFLTEASLSLLEARSSVHVKTIATKLREASKVNAHQLHRLCAVVQLDNASDIKNHQVKRKEKDVPAVACWGEDLEPPGGRHDNDHSNFRDIALVPTQEELACKGRSWLPLASGENSFVGDPEQRLLDRNFRLLREDSVSSMRGNIADPRSSKIWKNARIIGASCTDTNNPNGFSPLFFLVQFDLIRGKTVDWARQRALPLDGLIAFFNDENTHIMASIFVRKCDVPGQWLLNPSGPVIGVIFHHDNDIMHAIGDISENKNANKLYQMYADKLTNAINARKKENVEKKLCQLMTSFKTYTMVEASDSFFAYRPVLESIQAMISVPLAQELVHIENTQRRPSYMPRRVKLPSEFNRFECDLDQWSDKAVVSATTLDDSQSEALHMALISRVALIQGPPGKHYIHVFIHNNFFFCCGLLLLTKFVDFLWLLIQ